MVPGAERITRPGPAVSSSDCSRKGLIVSEMSGASPEELDALSRAMANASERIKYMTGELNQRMHGDVWRGPDAVRARTQWDSTLRQNLQSVASALHDASGTLSRQADEQRDASAMGRGPAVGTPLTVAHQSDAPPLSLSGVVAHGIETGVADWTPFDFVHSVVQAARSVSGAVAHGPLESALGGVGLGLAAVDMAEGVRDGNAAQFIWGGLDAAAPYIPGVDLIWPIFSDSAHMMVPVGDAQQDDVLNYMAQDLYGRNLDQLSPNEISTITDNLDGPAGMLYMMGGTLSMNISKMGLPL